MPLATIFWASNCESAGEQGFVIQAAWPQYAPALTSDGEVTLAVQVNGKLRGTLQRAQALALPPVAKHVKNRTVKTVLVVPGKIVSIVVE